MTTKIMMMMTRRRRMTTAVRSWEEKEGQGECKIRSIIVVTIVTREDLTRLMDAVCCIASMANGEAMRHLAREVRKSHRSNLKMRRILPNRLHVRIFLLRLMSLLYHQIKPVVIFNGVMPEVKRRKIRCRKDQQEKLW
jgi:hypothetical protein